MNKLNTIFKIVTFGIFIGFIIGLVNAIQLSSSQKYLHYGLYRLFFFELTSNINIWIIIGLITALIIALLIIGVSSLWKELIATFFEIKVVQKNNSSPLLKGLVFGLILVYLFVQIFRYVHNPFLGLKFILGHSLIFFCLVILFLWIEKKESGFLKEKILRFINGNGIKITAGAIVSIFFLINIINISVRISKRSARPNVLLIIADALRADHLGCYGYDRPTSSYIDRFAENSLVFENSMSNAPWTKPSMGTIFTSFYPHEHNAFYWTDNLSDENLTLAEVLRNRNYATYAFQTNPSISEVHNFHQGFKYYKESILEKADNVTSHFLSWVKRHKKKAFFAYLHYMDTHAPYDAPIEFSKVFGLKNDIPLIPSNFATLDIRILNEIDLSPEEKNQLIKLYDGAIKYFDNNFERIVKNLKEMRIFERTIIILTSDHGEEFWEHQGFAHGHTLYNELLHVPLIIRYPPALQPQRISEYVEHIDLFPTILDMIGIENDFDIRGTDLFLPKVRNKNSKKEIFFEALLYGAERKGILKDGWKLIENTSEKNIDTFNYLGDLTKYLYPKYEKRLELYNIYQDFSEKNNLIKEYPQIAARLKTYLELFKSESFERRKTKDKDREKKLKHLKSLGYVK